MFAEDLAPFFSTTEFADAATLAGVGVVGIFDNAYVQGTAGPLGMDSTGPAFTLPTANVPANPVGLAFVHAAVAYTVAGHEPNGTGVSVLLLERAA